MNSHFAVRTTSNCTLKSITVHFFFISIRFNVSIEVKYLMWICYFISLLFAPLSSFFFSPCSNLQHLIKILLSRRRCCCTSTWYRHTFCEKRLLQICTVLREEGEGRERKERPKQSVTMHLALTVRC